MLRIRLNECFLLFLAFHRARLFFVLLFFPEAYKAVGRALEWDVLGVAEDETAMQQYREEVGALADRRWKRSRFSCRKRR